MKHFNLLKTTLLLCALIVGSLSGWATDVTYNFSSFTSEQTVTLKTDNDNLTITLSKGSGSTNPAWTSSQAKVYAKGSLTIASASKKIASIVYTYSVNENKKGNKPTVSSVKGSESDGTWDSDSKTWTGSDKEITFATSGDAGNIGFTKLEITYEAEEDVTSLSVKSAPTKVRYEVGEDLDMTGFVLDADGTDVSEGYTMTIGGSVVVNGATLSSAGKKSITVSYGGKEVTQNISVGAVTSIAITTPPTKTSYDTGDSFDATGMVVTASLSTGEVSEPDTWTKEVTGYTVDLDDNLTPSNTAATITYATKTTTQSITVTDVTVTGVSLKSSTTIEKGKSETLIPTFTPANATNKNVTWESDNTSVATVEGGVVTAVAAGTATITVTTKDGDKTATCEVIVVNQKGGKDAPYTVAEVRNGDAAGKSNVWVKGYIVGSWNHNAFNSSDLVNSNLALADNYDSDTTIPVELTSGSGLRTDWGPSSNQYKVGVMQILVKGNGQDYFGLKAIKGASEIEAIAEAITVTSAGFSTYASDFGLDFSGLDVKAYKARVNETTITFYKVTEVPAGEGVLLQGEGTFEVPVKSVDAWAADDNAFVRGTGAAVATGDGPYNYILNKVNSVVGFYKANGQTVAKNRAYLQSTTAAARISLNFDEETTGISEVVKSDVNNKVFDLQGRHIAQPTKGLYIMNGRKVLVK